MEVINTTFVNGIREIRKYEKTVAVLSSFFDDYKHQIEVDVQMVVKANN